MVKKLKDDNLCLYNRISKKMMTPKKEGKGKGSGKTPKKEQTKKSKIKLRKEDQWKLVSQSPGNPHHKLVDGKKYDLCPDHAMWVHHDLDSCTLCKERLEKEGKSAEQMALSSISGGTDN
eukprot:15330105-Ditylum_brightwellii.AAC.1